MRILAIEPYYGGSHRAFLDGWREKSRHDWTLITFPAHGWKWRMRHSALSAADRARELAAQGGTWDLVFCSDMLNLAEFAGLAPRVVRHLPKVVYFHENQLTYPIGPEDRLDLHFGLTNMTAALAADAVWFNSAYHRDSFLPALREWLAKMRPPRMLDVLDRIAQKASVQAPGIGPVPFERNSGGPLRILWSARWEFDKNPELFFEAMELLEEGGADFRLSVIGEQFRRSPEIFQAARQRFADRIDRWGYQDPREQYLEALREADVAVSTADHEFFGISMVEAAAAGAFPLVTRRLAYPEVFGDADVFHDGTARPLADRLAQLSQRIKTEKLTWCDDRLFECWKKRYSWDVRASEMDDALERTAANGA